MAIDANSLNIIDDSDITPKEDEGSKKKPKKKAKKGEELTEETAQTPNSNVVKEEKTKEEPKTDKTSDPREEFVAMVEATGIKRGKADLIANAFFKGNIDDPSWMDTALALGDLSMQHRKLIITNYYGDTPENLGITLLPVSKMKQSGQLAGNQQGQPEGEFDVDKEYAEALKARYKMAQRKKFLKDIEEMEKSDRPPTVPKRVVQRPVIKADGSPLIDEKTNQPVMERVEYVGDGVGSGGGDGNYSMMFMMNMMQQNFLAMLKEMKESSNKTPPVDPNVKPSWAIEMENRLAVSKSEEEKKRLEDEVKREKEKREEAEKEHRREMEKEKEQMEKELDREREQRERDMERIEEKWANEIKHRDELNQYVGAITQKHDAEMKTIKDQLELNKKDLQATVVGEASKTVTKTSDKVGDIVEGFAQPMAEMMRDNWKTQIDLTRKAQGLPPLTVPKVTDDEIRKVIQE